MAPTDRLRNGLLREPSDSPRRSESADEALVLTIAVVCGSVGIRGCGEPTETMRPAVCFSQKTQTVTV